MLVVELILIAIGVYVGLGMIFAIWFVIKGVGRVDLAARGGPLGFRLLIFPGSAALWPLLLKRCIRAPGKGSA